MSHPYEHTPPKSFWRSGVVAADRVLWPDIYTPGFEIKPHFSVACLGGGFAQEFGRLWHQITGAFLDAEPRPKALEDDYAKAYGFDQYSARFGPILTPRKTRELIEDALSGTVHEGLFWREEGRFYDALRPDVEPEGCVSLVEAQTLRQDHLLKVAGLFQVCDLCVIQLSETDAFVERGSGRCLERWPDHLLGPEKLSVYTPDPQEVLEDLEQIVEILQHNNAGIKILFALDPTPLPISHADQHVLQRHILSKSVLRMAMGQVAQKYNKVDYFPSYEIGSFTGSADLPEIDGEVLSLDQLATQIFLMSLPEVEGEEVPSEVETLDESAAQSPEYSPETLDRAAESEDIETEAAKTGVALQTDDTDELICEEALLEALRK